MPSLKIKETIEKAEKEGEEKKIIIKPKNQSPKNEVSNSGLKASYGTGKRKNAIARVWVKIGSGKIVVNNKLLDEYFSNAAHKIEILKPFTVTDTISQYEVFCTVKGGGSSGQAGAIRHGISKALNILVPDFHKVLRENGLLTRDSRVVERKKYGRHKARKSTQFSKR